MKNPSAILCCCGLLGLSVSAARAQDRAGESSPADPTALVREVGDPDIAVRNRAVAALLELGADAAAAEPTRVLEGLLAHGDPGVRAAARMLLARLEPFRPLSTQQIVAILSDRGDPQLQRAIAAVEQGHVPIERVDELLAERIDFNNQINERIIALLQREGVDRRAVAAVLEKKLATGREPALRAMMRTLPESELMEALLRSGQETRGDLARRGLMELARENDEALEAIAVLLDRGDGQLRQQIVTGLWRVGPRALALWPRLRSYLPVPRYTDGLATLLVYCGEAARPAVPDVIQVLETGSPFAGMAAARGLRRLSPILDQSERARVAAICGRRVGEDDRLSIPCLELLGDLEDTTSAASACHAALGSSAPAVRAAALRVAAQLELGTPEITTAVGEAESSADPELARTARFCKPLITGDYGADDLRAALRSGDADRVRIAVGILHLRMAPPDIYVHDLRVALGCRQSDIIRRIADILGRGGEEARPAVAALRRAVTSTTAIDRVAVERTLAHLGEPPSPPPPTALSARDSSHLNDLRRRGDAAQPEIVAWLDNGAPLEVELRLLQLLGEHKKWSKPTIEAVTGRLTDDDIRVRGATVSALRRQLTRRTSLEDPVVTALQRIWLSGVAGERQLAAFVLRRMRPKRLSNRALRREVECEVPMVRAAAYQQIALRGSPRDRALFLAALADHDAHVQRSALHYFARAGRPPEGIATRLHADLLQPMLRPNAAQLLKSLGEPSLSILVDLTEDPVHAPLVLATMIDLGPTARPLAAYALRALRGGVPLRGLRGAARSHQLLETRKRAARALVALQLEPGDEMLDAMVSALREDFGETTPETPALAELLGTLGPEASFALPGLRAGLDARDVELRDACALALARLGETEAIQDWLESAVSDRNYRSQQAALRAVAAMEQPSAKALELILEPALNYSSPVARDALLRAFGSASEEQTARAIERMLEFPRHPYLRDVLASLGAKTVDGVLRRRAKGGLQRGEDLKLAARADPGELWRRRAELGEPALVQVFVALRASGDDGFVGIIAPYLSHDEAAVRRAAALGLGGLGPNAMTPLLAALREADAADGAALIAGLAELGAEGAPALPEIAKWRKRTEADAASVAPHYRRFGPAGVVELARLAERDARLVVEVSKAASDRDAGTASAALRALARLRRPETMPAVLRALEFRDDRVPWAALAVLALSPSPDVVRQLAPAVLESETPIIRRRGFEALRDLVPLSPELMALVVEGLEDEDPKQRRLAAAVLEGQGSLASPAQTAIREALAREDQDEEVREILTRLLSQLSK